jgi:hypothetical protein
MRRKHTKDERFELGELEGEREGLGVGRGTNEAGADSIAAGWKK